MKKLISLVLSLAMILMVGAAFAQTVSLGQGSGSITVSNAEVGKTYELYKLFDATVGEGGIIAYSLPASKVSGIESDAVFNKYFEIKQGNIYKKDALTDAVIGVQDGEFQTWASSFGIKIGNTVTAEDSTVKFDGIAYGYYFIKSNVGTMLTIDSANPEATVIDKNQTNESDKVIVETGNKEVIVNEAGIQENVTFKLTETVKNYDKTEKIYRYQIEDQLDPAFSYNKDAVVKVGTKTLVADTEYTITYNDNVPSFVILIPWTDDDTFNGNHLYDNNSVITVVYTAKLDRTKIQDNPNDLHVGATPNKNVAQLKWFKGSENPTIPNGELPEDRTDTFDTQLTVLKKNNKGEILTGAEFTLTSTNGTNVVLVTEGYYDVDAAGEYWKLTDGTYTKEAPNGNATHDSKYDDKDTKYALKSRQYVKDNGITSGSTVSAFVDKDGKAKFTGLGVGTYTLSETVVPAGYNKVEDITFTITFDDDPNSATYLKFASNNTAIVLDADNNIFDTTVINNQGTELPSTGGIGTTIFYILGGLLVIGAAVILVARRKAQD